MRPVCTPCGTCSAGLADGPLWPLPAHIGQVLPDRLGELDGHREIVTHCHHGSRSLKALEILKAAGFSKVRSLRGGIDAWAVNVDRSLPRY